MADPTLNKQAYIKVTQIRSTIGRIERQKRTAKALGLGRVNSSRVLPDNPAVRGMIDSISHLVRIEKVAQSPSRAVVRNLPVKTNAKLRDLTEPKTKPAAKKTAAKEVAPKPASAKAPSAAKAPEGKTADKKETKS